MLTLIENGDVYAPEHLDEQSILLVDGRIGRIGDVDRNAVEALGIDVDYIDAGGCLICPGFIDPHEQLLGGSGEEGFATQTPEIHISEIVCAGITTVVGTLGVDTTDEDDGRPPREGEGPARGRTDRLPLVGRLQRARYVHRVLGARGHDVHRRGDRSGRDRHCRRARY